MLQTRINGHKVTIFVSHDAKQLFIDNVQGKQIYACRLAKRDSAIRRAKMIVGQN